MPEYKVLETFSIPPETEIYLTKKQADDRRGAIKAVPRSAGLFIATQRLEFKKGEVITLPKAVTEKINIGKLEIKEEVKEEDSGQDTPLDNSAFGATKGEGMIPPKAGSSRVPHDKKAK